MIDPCVVEESALDLHHTHLHRQMRKLPVDHDFQADFEFEAHPIPVDRLYIHIIQ